MTTLRTPEDLLALYGPVPVRAAGKVHPALDAHDRAFVAASPFLVLATSSPDGLLDCSPRGDRPGFVTVLEDGRMVLPDRPGNNRVDSLLNVLSDPRASLILLVPGLTHTLRVNGTAVVTTDPDVLVHGAVNGRLPKTALVLTPVEVMYQCGRALVRSRLWEQAEAPDLPSLDEVLADQVEGLTLEQSLRFGAEKDPLW
ncbi:MAG: pyridoxamine 5-phosphate oxidase family protein [Frankiales bacterium]|nr:pyridoxamine 5-phosphate oxidase family protein [Frankiales bacterium]MCW2680070.1 pyridoxamine 5-phosphate oxidase family protein [Frankiales bacterium]